MRQIRIIVFFVLFASFMPARPSAQGKPGNESWRILDQARSAYDAGELGTALSLCEKARELHAAEISGIHDSLQKALSPAQVRKAGDDIESIRATLLKRNEDSAVAVLDTVLRAHPPAFFGKSAKRMLSWLERRMVYPEADYLAGKIFEAEGEPAVSREFYENAWKNREFLDIPDERFDILYRLADIAEASGDYGGQERYLLALVAEDPVFGKPGEESDVLTAMIRTLETEATADKFFLLYRHRNPVALKAYRDLAHFYYFRTGKRIDRALPAAVLAASISVTMLSDAVLADDFTYVYSGLADLMVRTGKKAALREWAGKEGLWEPFVTLARVLFERDRRPQAESILTCVLDACPDQNVVREAQALRRQTARPNRSTP